jgi:hypothetical protein
MLDQLTTHRLPECKCPHCKKTVSAAAGAENGPSSGDISICAYCGCVNIYTPNMMLRSATKEDLADMSTDDLNHLMAMIMHVRERISSNTLRQ